MDDEKVCPICNKNNSCSCTINFCMYCSYKFKPGENIVKKPIVNYKVKIDELRTKLWFHRCLYYEYNTNEISDFEYDTLERSLTILESKTEHLIEDSPTRRVGYNPPDYLKPSIENLVKNYFKNLEI